MTVHDTLPRQELNLLIVIVCYRAADLTIDCLRSLQDQIVDVPRARVAVCENGTGEESVKQIAEAIDREGWSDWVWLKAIHPNRGFAGGNNVILEEAMSWPTPPRFFLLLNADTIVRPGALKAMMAAAEKHPETGIIGPRLEWPDGQPQISCFRYINPISEMLDAARTSPLSKLLGAFEVAIPVSDKPIRPQWTTFACALIRREVFEKVGVLDAGFYLYFDDPDFCRRARKAGWDVLYWPEAHVVHLRGRSNPVKSLTEQRKRRPPYFYASRARYFAKFYGRVGLWVTNLLWLAGRCVSLLREVVGAKEPHLCERQGRDIWTNCLCPMRAGRFVQGPNS